jgi:hypothetical protein
MKRNMLFIVAVGVVLLASAAAPAGLTTPQMSHYDYDWGGEGESAMWNWNSAPGETQLSGYAGDYGFTFQVDMTWDPAGAGAWLIDLEARHYTWNVDYDVMTFAQASFRIERGGSNYASQMSPVGHTNYYFEYWMDEHGEWHTEIVYVWPHTDYFSFEVRSYNEDMSYGWIWMSGVATPEPTTLFLLAAGALPLIRRRRV